MKAGRELDALVAEKVMGVAVVKVPAGTSIYLPDLDRFDSTPSEEYAHEGGNSMGLEPVPSYSTDIEAAWQVVEKMRPLKLFLMADFDGYAPADGFDGPDRGYQAAFFAHTSWEWALRYADGRDADKVWADTAPLAICLAALKAVGVEVPA